MILSQATKSVSKDTIEWALAHGVGFKTGPFSSMHIPFTLAPLPITKERFGNLKSKAGLLGKLVHKASEDDELLKQAMEPITKGDPFFKHLWQSHLKLQQGGQEKRLPLLIMRSDFMDDAKIGPKLIEFNAIAAGMGPFGQRIHELHKYINTQHPSHFRNLNTDSFGDFKMDLVENKAIDALADGIAKATMEIKNEFNDPGPPRFLMVVQPGEDNVYDQHLLEYALQERGIQTVRRSFRQLHDDLTDSQDYPDRLVLKDVGPIDSVYLRSGYLHCDFYAADLDETEEQCCQSLLQTRIFMEQHRVAMNATIRQQMASSKRVQTMLSAMEATQLANWFDLTIHEAQAVKELLGKNLPVTHTTIDFLQQDDQNVDDWVLKNQGEGGGHAVFGQDIFEKLQQLDPEDYDAWSIMQRLRPSPRPNILVRKGEPQICDDLISEIGVFTVHINGVPVNTTATTTTMATNQYSSLPAMANTQVASATAQGDDDTTVTTSGIGGGYAGYLIRSKPAGAAEGGVHSGMGVLDSLVYANSRN